MKYTSDDIQNDENDSDVVNDSSKMEELKRVIHSAMDDAKDFIDQIGQERALATEYYLGKEPGGTSSLQSEFVDTSVRDSILFMLPSIMRTFFGTKKVVEFIPKNAEDIPVAQQQTDYINYIMDKNDGFSVLYDAFKDSLVRKSGYVKAFWDDSISVSTHEYTDLSPEAYMALLMEKDVEVMEESVTSESMTMIDEMSGEEITQETPISYDLKIRRVKPKDQVVIEAIPPEEILISRAARDIHSSPYVAHRMIKSVGDLVAMGYDQDDMMDYIGSSDYLDEQSYQEQEARSPLDTNLFPDRSDLDDRSVLYIEHYVRYDLDEDGIDELIRVCTIGDSCHILNVSPWDELPIAMFETDPEPHTVIGNCPADYLIPIQASKSQIMRDTLDSLGHSIFPRMTVVEGQVNIDDVLNTDIGQPIRVRAPGMVQPMSIPFVGKESFPFMQYLDSLKEDRTGVSKAAAGLNADALQSSTKTAVTATVSAAQGRVELICRHLAEGGMKSLFKLINHLVIKHQDQEAIVRLNNEFVAVDPRFWDADKDISVNVAISKNSDEEKMQVLSMLAGKQEQILQMLGPDNPLVTMQQYANTLSRMIEMAGFKDSTAFVNTNIPPMPPQQGEQKPDPAEMLAQAEINKAEVQAQKAMIDSETDRMKIIMEDDFKRDEAEAEIALKAAELRAKYGAQVSMTEIKALMERDREILRQVAKTQATGLFNGSGG
tara:strand:+ start:2979 stop:5123 length:2145 start_codon:yes stop_codon:yes gene_type:complete